MKLIRKAGVTSQSVYVLIQDSASTTGAGKTGIAWNAAGMVASYVRTRGSRVAITLATLGAVNSAYSSGGWIEVDSTNLPGVYRLDIPDAALASGADSCVVCVRGASGAVDCVLEIDLVAYDPADTVRLGLTALPNVASGSAGAIITSGTGTAQLSTSSGNVTVGTNSDKTGYSLSQTFPTNFSALAITAGGIVQADLQTIKTQTVTCSGGVTVPAATLASTSNITTVGAVSGAVGSVTGSVGSISGVTFPTNFSALGINASGHVSRVVLCDTITTYTGNTPQTGDSFARIGATGSGLTSLAPAATALSTATWTTARAGYLDSLNTGVTLAASQIVVKKNTALSAFPFLMVLASDHVTGATGRTVTATRSIDGGAFASCTNSPAEVSNGMYRINLSAADLNGNTITLRFTAATCDDTFITILTQP